MAIQISRENKITDTVTGRSPLPSKQQMSFDRMMEGARSAVHAEELKTLLGKVDQQARRVAVSRTVRDVQLYKKYVRSFIRAAVQSGLRTKQSRSWQRGAAVQTLIGTVDEKLITLTEDLLDKNKNELNLLKQLGEIRGLLINLYI
ncbi:DUF327 family protein [Sporolactobacillus sp. THM7-7]|nr:DUF327 family protein [Sporolactobacillus sp. THM7-7]